MGQVLERKLTVQERPARVWRGGSGPALLLLHGGFGDARLHWEPVWTALADSFTVAAPDLPGFGGTAPLPNASFSAFADWVSTLMETLGFPRSIVVGNSFGGGVARLYAAANPARVVRLILVNGGALPHIPGPARFLMRLPLVGDWTFEMIRRRTFSPAGLRPLFADNRRFTPDFIARSQKESRGFVRAMRQAALADMPARQTPLSPTLLLWGEADRFAPLSRARELAAVIPGAQLQSIPAGHMPQIERPAEFVAAVRQFCGRR